MADHDDPAQDAANNPGALSVTIDEAVVPDLPSVLLVYMLNDGYTAGEAVAMCDRLIDEHDAQVRQDAAAEALRAAEREVDHLVDDDGYEALEFRGTTHLVRAMPVDGQRWCALIAVDSPSNAANLTAEEATALGRFLLRQADEAAGSDSDGGLEGREAVLDEAERRIGALRAESHTNNGETQRAFRDGLQRAEAVIRCLRKETN